MSRVISTTPKIVFMGTPEFAAFCLEALHKVYPIHTVVTIEDKPIGRGLKLAESAVKKKAIEIGITNILQPSSLKDESFVQQIETIQPDIIVVIAFKILPKKVYSLSKIGSFNIHGSLLPKYRGAAPIQWAIIRGEIETGVTTFLLTDVVDTGNILGQRSFKLEDHWTAADLHDAMMPYAAELTIDTCRQLLEDVVIPLKQNDTEATTAPKLFRENTQIDWNDSVKLVINFVRGLTPYPSAWTVLEEETMKVYALKTYSGDVTLSPNEYIMTNTEFLVGCTNGVVSIEMLQLPNKSKMKTSDFLRGFRGNRVGKFPSVKKK